MVTSIENVLRATMVILSHITIHFKKKLVNLTRFGCFTVAKVFALSYAQLPVLKGVAESLMVYYMRE